MKILLLATSDDLARRLPECERPGALVTEILESALNEPVEVIVRGVWPEPGLPAIVASWLERYEPDVVFISVNTYSFTYLFAPLKIARMLGRRWEQQAERLCLQDRPTAWFWTTRGFRVLRALALRVIGGESYISPVEYLALNERILRTVVSRESIIAVQRGPLFSSRRGLSAKAIAEAESRTATVHLALTELCARLKVEYISRVGTEMSAEYLTDDGVHRNARFHRRQARIDCAAILHALAASRDGSAPAGAARGPS